MANGNTATVPSLSQPSRIGAFLGRINPLTFVLIALYFGVSLISDRFLAMDNQLNITRQAAVFLIVAIGQTFVIASRGIDLSVGSIVGVTGCVMARMLVDGVPVPVALGAGIALGAAVGLVNGLVITRLDVNPLIATLGMLVALRGATHLFMGNDVVVRLPQAVRFLGQGEVLGLPMPALMAGAIALFGWWLLFQTRFGRYAQAIGSNEAAVGLVGVKVNRVKVLLYVMQGVFCAIGAAVLIGRLNGTSPELGFGMELHIIAGVVLGGTALYGGVGSIGGTVLGILTIGVIENGMVLVRADFHLQRVLIGVLLVGAVAYQGYRRRQAERTSRAV
jgi:ribose/xylose/arabinose/galactoside ABC-type transport system permease subunit